MSRSARDGYGTSRQLTPIPLSRADADPRNVLHEDDPSILVAGSSLISRSSSLWKGQLRHRTFFRIAELNEAIWEQLEILNARPMQKLGVSRRELYERLDRPALKPLPQERYELSKWKWCRVNIDYHVNVDNNLYSVPVVSKNTNALPSP